MGTGQWHDFLVKLIKPHIMTTVQLNLQEMNVLRHCADACKMFASQQPVNNKEAFLNCVKKCEYLLASLIRGMKIFYSDFEECAEACSDCISLCDNSSAPEHHNCIDVCRKCEEICNVSAVKSINYYQTICLSN